MARVPLAVQALVLYQQPQGPLGHLPFISQGCCWEGGTRDVHSALGLGSQGSLGPRLIRLV